MSRKYTAKKKSAKYDPICDSRFVNMLVNRMMKDGKKSLAYKIFYRAAIDIKQNTGKNPISVFREALFRVTPRLIVKTRKLKKGKTYKIPLAIPFKKGALLGIRWLLGASRQRSGTNMASQLSAELRDAAFKKRGNAIRKREQSHKIAEASKTFAHLKSEEIPFSAKSQYAAFKKPGNAIHKKEQKQTYFTYKVVPIPQYALFHSPSLNSSSLNRSKTTPLERKKHRRIYSYFSSTLRRGKQMEALIEKMWARRKLERSLYVKSGKTLTRSYLGDRTDQ